MTLLATLGDLVPLVTPAGMGLLSDVYISMMVLAVVTLREGLDPALVPAGQRYLQGGGA